MERKKSKLKLNKRRVIVLIVLAIICVLLLIGLVNLIKLIFAKEEVAGNLANMGLAVSEGNLTFYNKYEEGIVKIKGGEEYQITEETAYSIHLEDDTVYYLTLSNSNTLDLKSVKTNGDQPKKIKTLSTPSSKFYVEDNYIYYISNKDGMGIVKYSLDTNEENFIVTYNVQDFVLAGKEIFFVDNTGTLYSVGIDGSDFKTISNEYNIRRIQVLKNWIYFYNTQENALCKIKKDGSKMKVVATFVNNETYNVTSKYVYYMDEVNKQICRCDLKGKKSNAIVSLKSSRTKINIVDDKLYYLDDSESESRIYQMYRVKTNGHAAKPIEY